jgi:hypothetical protein
MVPFGKWLPDLAPTTECLEICDNFLPYNNKYYPLLSPKTLTSSAISGLPIKIYTAKNSETSYTAPFFGTTTKLYRGASLTNVSRTLGYSTINLETSTWSMDVYGDAILASNGIDSIQIMSNVETGTFSDLVGGTAPVGKNICMFKDSLFIGSTIEGPTRYPRRLFRSAMGDIEDWVVDSATGCGFYDLPSWGEEIVGFSKHGDYLLVFMTNSIWLVTFMGAPLWYSYTKIYEGVCAISPGCIAALGNMDTLVLTPTDVLRVRGTSVSSIGYGIRSTLSDWFQLYPYKVTNIVDTQRKLVMWSYPTNNFYGYSDKLLIYNYDEDRFTSSSGNTLSCIGEIIIPETKAIRYTCHDATQNKFSTLEGTPRIGTIQTSELSMDSVTTAIQVEPRIEGLNGTLTTTVYHKLNERLPYSETSANMNSQGLCNLRASGRYLKGKFVINGSHSGFYGYVPRYATKGRR